LSTSSEGSTASLEGKEIPKNIRDLVDKLYYSPSERASFVNALRVSLHEHLRNRNIEQEVDEAEGIPNDWDYLAFAVEYVAMQAVAIGDEEFLEAARALVNIFYSWHYGNPTDIYGPPDRKKTNGGTTESTQASDVGARKAP
jgi:hypothetical protein